MERFPWSNHPSGWPRLLLVIGRLETPERTACFVSVTIPHHYGSNPGFCAHEASWLPRWLILSTGVGLMTSERRVWLCSCSGSPA